jgi:hypothetical protein
MTGPCKRNFEMERRRAEQQARRRFEQGGGLLAPISGAHRPGGLEKQARHPHGHSHTKHEDGDGGHRGTAVQALGSEMLSNTPIVTSYCVTQSFWGMTAPESAFRARAGREYRHRTGQNCSPTDHSPSEFFVMPGVSCKTSVWPQKIRCQSQRPP